MQQSGTDEKKFIIGLILAVLASRFIFYLLGIRYDAEEITTLWQIIDIQLLKQDLFRSLFYMHFQPPLFNALVGLVLKISPDGYPNLLATIYLFLGLLMTYFMYKIIRILGASPIFSSVMTFYFMIIPPTILYENWIFYTYIDAVLLLIMSYYFYKSAFHYSPKHVALVMLIGTILVLTRSVFHIIWLIACVGFLLLSTPRVRVAKTFIVALPFVLIGASWYAKNAWLYGWFTASTAFGMSLAKMTQPVVSQATIDKLIQEGQISQVYLVPRYSPIEKYPSSFLQNSPYDHPLLTSARKSTGEINLNHYSYIEISKKYQSDVVNIIKHDPVIILKIFSRSVGLFFMPASDYPPFLEPNYSRIAGYDYWWSRLLQLRFAHHTREQLKDNSISMIYKVLNIGFVNLIIYLFVLFHLTFSVLQKTKEKSKELLFNTFLLFNISFLSLICIFFETGENNRFRYEIDPLVWAIFCGVIGGYLYRKSNQKRSSTINNNLHKEPQVPT